MATATNEASASAALSPADGPADNNPAIIEHLSEELSIQQAVLASLLDLPEASSTKQEIAAVRATITGLKGQLGEARGKGSHPSDSTAAAIAFTDLLRLLSPVIECKHEQHLWDQPVGRYVVIVLRIGSTVINIGD